MVITVMGIARVREARLYIKMSAVKFLEGKLATTVGIHQLPSDRLAAIVTVRFAFPRRRALIRMFRMSEDTGWPRW